MTALYLTHYRPLVRMAALLVQDLTTVKAHAARALTSLRAELRKGR